MNTSVSGKCLCGAVTFKATRPPNSVRTCWCRDCQYWAAGSATVNAVFDIEAISIDGEMAYHESRADSGSHMKRGFCPKCGTPMTSGADERPHLMIVRLGVLDEAEKYGPQMTIWTSSAPKWAQIDPDLPQYEKGMPAAPEADTADK